MVFDARTLGATGEFPEGKLDESDEGELRLAVGVDRDLNVRIDFGKPVAWLAMAPEQALELGEMIVKQAYWARDHRGGSDGSTGT